ncbi:MAG: glycoside hydrolase [Elusimicrobiota bacterium]|nr:glycoside hydrolase [Elusimicrobiota bacterium]
MNKTNLAFLWHQHQPVYKNPQTDVYELPWVRLHATKDYFDMVAILDDFPKIKLNFNFVPSLLVQLEEYASGKAKDKYLLLTLKNPADLNDDEKIFILLNFFAANWDNIISKNNRYLQLLEHRGHHTSAAEVAACLALFKEQDFRDLQVWFNLAWFDPYWKKTDSFIAGLFAKGRDFTEAEKHELIKKQLEICGKIAAKHKEVQDRGQIEVSISPFYHPILPLLCDTDCAKEAMPHITLLKKRYAHPEDAVWQIQEALNYYEKIFGFKPKGMWPSEGSVSNLVSELIAESQVKWIATDEAVLYNSSSEPHADRRQLFRPYTIERNGKNINIIFRDHGLSDAIGFVYSKWNAKDAVNDFMAKLYDIRNYIGDSIENPLISVILDGENCWEYYSNDGWDFLNELYQRLSDNNDFETVRISDYLEKFPPVKKLNNIVAGSWINGNFQIWIGDEEDRTAWERLGETRDFLYGFLKQNPEYIGSDNAKDAFTALRTAQGSDWTWWYGMDHASDDDAMFDFLYRSFLMKVYQSFEQRVPDNLYIAIKNTLKRHFEKYSKAPSGYIYPVLDGIINDEWLASGYYITDHAGGSMHQVSSVIKKVCFARNENNIFIGIMLNDDVFAKIVKNLDFKIIFSSPIKSEIDIAFDGDKNLTEFVFVGPEGRKKIVGGDARLARDMEIAVPISVLNFPQGSILNFRIIIYKNGFELEECPKWHTLQLEI